MTGTKSTLCAADIPDIFAMAADGKATRDICEELAARGRAVSDGQVVHILKRRFWADIAIDPAIEAKVAEVREERRNRCKISDSVIAFINEKLAAQMKRVDVVPAVHAQFPEQYFTLDMLDRMIARKIVKGRGRRWVSGGKPRKPPKPKSNGGMGAPGLTKFWSYGPKRPPIPLPACLDSEALPGSVPVSFGELDLLPLDDETPCRCRFYIGKAGDPPDLFCGEVTAPGRAYCDTHWLRSMKPRKPKPQPSIKAEAEKFMAWRAARFSEPEMRMAAE